MLLFACLLLRRAVSGPVEKGFTACIKKILGIKCPFRSTHLYPISLVNSMPNTKTTLTQKFLLVFLGAFLLLVLIEGGLRAAGSINSAWQKHKNRSLFQRQDVIRIMCIGESTTYLGGPNSYPSQLEVILNQSGSKNK